MTTPTAGPAALRLVFDGRPFPVGQGGSAVIGRDLACDITVSDSRASRRHAEVRFDGSVGVLVDLGSSNGTYVDGQRVPPGSPVPLPHGSSISLGAADGPRVVVTLVGPAPAARLAPTHGPPSAPTRQPTGPSPSPASSAARVSQPLPQRRSGALLPSNPSHTGVVFDQWSLPSGPITTRTPPPGSGRATVTGAVPQVLAVAPQTRTAGGPGLTIGRGLENQIVVDDLLASRQHARLTPRPGGGFDVHDLGSRNGTYVNGQRIQHGVLAEGGLLAVGHSRFTVRHGQLVASVDEGDVNFVANHLTFTLDGGKKLLDDISFALEGSSLLAVIGPSGAGKSTLLKALTGAQQATEGEVYYDGRDLYQNYQDLRHRIGVVPQDDVVHRQLTVQQALRFAAELRFPDDLDRHLREQRVDEVLAELDLTGHAETRVDKLSGGQRKRTSVALELLTRPSLLFLDEPTSGLDPGLDKQVMRTLRGLADGGRTVVVITHSVANLGVCDKVLLLAPGGKVAYFGPPTEMLPFFGAADHADIFTGVSRDPEGAKSRFRTSPLMQEQVEAPLRAPRPFRPGPPEKPPRQQSIPSQLSTLARRHLRVILADRGYAAFMLLLPVVLAVLTMVVPGKSGLGMPIPPQLRTTEAMQLLVVLIIGAIFMGMAASIRELVGERAIYLREKAVGLSPQAYLWGKLTIFGLLTLAQSAIMVLLVLTRKPGPEDALLFGSPSLELIITCWFTAFTAVALGLLASSFVKTSEQVMPLLVIAVMAQLVLCGGLFPVNGRVGLEQLAWLTPARWGYAGTAATSNLRQIWPPADDPLWQHQPAYLVLALVMLILVGLGFTLLTLWRLARRTY